MYFVSVLLSNRFYIPKKYRLKIRSPCQIDYDWLQTCTDDAISIYIFRLFETSLFKTIPSNVHEPAWKSALYWLQFFSLHSLHVSRDSRKRSNRGEGRSFSIFAFWNLWQSLSITFHTSERNPQARIRIDQKPEILRSRRELAERGKRQEGEERKKKEKNETRVAGNRGVNRGTLVWCVMEPRVQRNTRARVTRWLVGRCEGGKRAKRIFHARWLKASRWYLHASPSSFAT